MSIGFDNCLALDCETGCEGIAVMWQSTASWDVIFVSNWFFG